MLLGAIRVLEEGIVRDPADLDVGVTLGLSFPVSRGGMSVRPFQPGPVPVDARAVHSLI
jgi:hypothetical protein